MWRQRIAAVVLAVGGSCFATSVAASAASPVSLVLDQSDAFAIIGHSCGGIQEQSYATGFDAVTGFADGVVFLSTTCSTGGRGSRPATFSAWATVSWDFTGAVVSSHVATSAPSVDPSLLVTDANGNQIYNSSKRAYLLLSPTYVPVPRVTAISVATGPSSGGTVVTITGTALSGATAVDFGALGAAGFAVTNDTSIVATSPVSPASSVPVTVVTPGGTSAAAANLDFTFVPQPVVTSLSPTSGSIAGGTTVTLIGSGFSAVTTVSLGDTPVGFTIVSDTEITFVTPPLDAPDNESVTVSSLGGTSASSGADQFSYVAPARLALSPVTGVVGTLLTFSGTGFAAHEVVTVQYVTNLSSPARTMITMCRGTTTSAGKFRCRGRVPRPAGPKGPHVVLASGAVADTATTMFTLK